MVFLSLLWVPIVVSAVLVFIVSAISHMLTPYRVREWSAAPQQGALQQALRGAKPGLYVFPSPEKPRDRGQADALKRWAEGPSGFLALVPAGPIRMGRNLGLSLLINLIVSGLAAYLAWHAFGPTAHWGAIFRLVGTAGFLAYCIGPLYEGIWYWRPWPSFAMTVVEAVLYGAVMAASFSWLWPH